MLNISYLKLISFHSIQLLKRLKNNLNFFFNYNTFINNKHEIKCFKFMENFVNKSNKNTLFKKILIDSIFDNPAYWYRISLLRHTINIKDTEEVFVVGKWYNRKIKKNLNYLNCQNIQNLSNFYPKSNIVKKITHNLIKNTNEPNDILKWKLPLDFPTYAAYDCILKQQRKNVVNINSPDFYKIVYDGIRNLLAACEFINHHNFDAIFMSQIINFDQGGIAWAALRKKIKVYLITGHGGLNRFQKKNNLNQLFYNKEHPQLYHLNQLNKSQLKQLKKFGKKYLNDRINGKTNELGSLYSYRINNLKVSKKDILSKFNWNPNLPIVCVYAQNWFDYPHAFGMKNFRDFRDWIDITISNIKQIKNVNWLIKPHPCDAWYGGETIKDIISDENYKNIKICPSNVSGSSLLKIVDGGVTVHGTIGLELSSLKKQVLLADNGWYGHFKFCKVAKSTEHYGKLLKEICWKDKISNVECDHLYFYVALMFCSPKWQSSILIGNDTEQKNLYPMINDIFKNHEKELSKEIDLIKKWMLSDETSLHTFKMISSKLYHNFQIPLTSGYLKSLKKRKI